MLGRASHGLDRVGVRAKHDVEAFRIGPVRRKEGVPALCAVGRFDRPADRAEALGKDFDDAVVAFFVSGLGVDGDQFGHFGREGAQIKGGFFPDFRQKSHFRCLKGSEVQDFRAFLL